MSFHLPDLIVESIIRDGLAALSKRPELIDDVFESLTSNYNRRKYGAQELEKIKNLILKNQINVVHSFGEVSTKVPCYSLQLGSDNEDKPRARLGDFEEDVQEVFTDPQRLADLIIVDQVVALSYNSKSGKLDLDDSVDMTKIRENQIFVDAAGNEFVIRKGKKVNAGSKFIFLDKGLDVDISDFGTIKSSLNYEQYEVNGVTSDVSVLIGVHTKDALTTKYLYVLLKYFLLSRKKDLIRRNFIVSSYNGSDFTRNMEYQGDIVYTRFLTVTGKIEDNWKGDDVELFDDLEIQVLVPKRKANANETNTTNSTVKPSDRDGSDCS